MSNFFLIWYIVGFISTIIGIIIHKKKLIDKDQKDPRDKFDATMTANSNPNDTNQMNPLNKAFPYHI